MILGGPALYLLGESLFWWRMTGETNVKRVAVAALLILLVPPGGQASALLLSLIVASLLLALAIWELRALSARQRRRRPHGTCPRARREAPCGC
jgi:low temperature requirement protein LtrA